MGSIPGLRALVREALMGDVLGRLWMGFLSGGTGGGRRKRQVTFSRVVFPWTTCVFYWTGV
jgi:hypothetical protein